MAQLCWDNYRKRNDSVVVDLFQGQYRSTIVCQTCTKVSVTFDPFMYLSLPLPLPERTWPVVIVLRDPAQLPRLVRRHCCARQTHRERTCSRRHAPRARPSGSGSGLNLCYCFSWPD